MLSKISASKFITENENNTCISTSTKFCMTKVRYIFIALLSMIVCATSAHAQTPAAPADLTATAFERHIELQWQPSPGTNIYRYNIYRSDNGGTTYTFLQGTPASTTFFTDWTGDEGLNLTRLYQVKAESVIGVQSDYSNVATGTTADMDDNALRDMVSQATFRYFWDFAHPISGLARERNTSGETVTTGGSGFGIMAIVVGTERGWVTREDAVNRMIKIATFLQFADRFHGAFPHWMNGTNGNVQPFSQFDNGGDLVETAFLMEGLLAARQYFDQNTPLEAALRDVITGLWEDVEWDWYRRNNSNVLYWHWSPNYAWQMNFPLRGFNEAHIVYILAAASPTHPIPASLYTTGWQASGYKNISIQFGYPVYCGPFGGGPLFFAHYSYVGFDPRRYKDNVCNYFVRNRNHALIQHAYSVANPEQHLGYSADCWGLTASDDPFGYSAHDIYPNNDNGTISPTAALASMPYTPDESTQALRYFYRVQGEKIWGHYGFTDAFNLNENWFATAYLAIDQGPIVAMLENYRSGLLWDKFMQNPEIVPALLALGFVPDNSATQEHALQTNGFDIRISPNPLAAGVPLQIEFSVLEKQILTANIVDIQGKVIQTLFANRALTAGIFTETFQLEKRPQGTYFLQIKNSTSQILTKKIVTP